MHEQYDIMILLAKSRIISGTLCNKNPIPDIQTQNSGY